MKKHVEVFRDGRRISFDDLLKAKPGYTIPRGQGNLR
jgi:hypothetical protein